VAIFSNDLLQEEYEIEAWKHCSKSRSICQGVIPVPPRRWQSVCQGVIPVPPRRWQSEVAICQSLKLRGNPLSINEIQKYEKPHQEVINL